MRDVTVLQQASADELRRNARIGDPVEIRIRRSGAHKETWMAGKIEEVAGRGLIVRTDGGKKFVYWSDIRRAVEVTEPPKTLSPKPMTTLGEIVHYRNQSKPTKPPAAPAEPKSDPPALAQRKPRERKAHEPTLIGETFRRWRMSQKMSQRELSDLLGVSQNRMSHIETGDMLPSDDLLIAFAEKSAMDLTALLDQRDGKQSEPEPAVEAAASPPPPAPPPEVAREAFVLPAPPPFDAQAPAIAQATEEAPGEFMEWLSLLDEIAPPPADRQARKKWFRIVKELYEVSR